MLPDNKEFFLVWERTPTSWDRDHEEVVGYIHAPYQEADELIALMNAAEEKISGKSPFRRGWGINPITTKNYKEYATQ